MSGQLGSLVYLRQQPQQHGADKYHGAVAQGYDAKREDSPKWIAEQRIIEDMLSDLPAGDWVLDCPVGTGRFMKFYAERRLRVHGIDKSREMLAQADQKSQTFKVRHAIFNVGDIRSLFFGDKVADAAVCCRLTRWLSPEDCTRAIHELARVTRKRIIFTARVRNHPHARPYELFQVDGWRIIRDESTGGDEDLRVVMMEPA